VIVGERRRADCPVWCVVEHGQLLGEEDRLHLSAPVVIADGAEARLCISSDPSTGAVDGPYVLIGDDERTVQQVDQIVERLTELIAAGRLTPSAAPGTPLPGP
jgi:hypothetical protein